LRLLNNEFLKFDAMIKLNNLKPAAGSTHSRRRIGRGTGSGLGGTSTRGSKGAKSRSGYKRKFGFEGGQMPLQRRVPKAGFKNINHKEYLAVNLSSLQKLVETKNLTKIGLKEMNEGGLFDGNKLIKVLGDGELKAKVDVEANAFSKSAEQAITTLGGKATII
jgi:large subunit ribosomal protein L15